MKSIKRGLTAGLLAGFAVLLGGGALLIYYSARAALYRQFDSQLRSEALSIISLTSQERRDIDVDFSDRYLREFDREVATRFYQVTHTNGRVVEVSDSLGKQRLPFRPGTLDAPALWNLDLPTGKPGRALAFDFVPHSNRDDRKHHNPNLRLNLVVAADRRQLNGTLASLRTTLITASAGTALGAMLLVMAIVARGMRPVRQLAAQAAAIDATKLNERFPTAGMPLELQPICRGLNEVLARLEQSFERERRFSADVAHELRTPIAELKSLSEVALKWPANRESTAAFGDTLAIANQMEAIVTALLGIARCESGRLATEVEPIEVRALVAEAWRPFNESAAAKSHVVEMRIPEGTSVRSDRALLNLILANLFSNAVAYTPRRGSIRVACEMGNPSFALSVINTTEGLEQQDLAKMFQRFWRKDAARSSSEHSGLGLALAQAFAERLGLALRAELVGSSLVMTLSGPIAPKS